MILVRKNKRSTVAGTVDRQMDYVLLHDTGSADEHLRPVAARGDIADADLGEG